MFQHLSGDRLQRADDAFERQLEYAAKAEEHVWVAMTVHRIGDATARVIAAGAGGADTPVLDVESIVTVEVGCYRCERPLEARLVGRRCRGV